MYPNGNIVQKKNWNVLSFYSQEMCNFISGYVKQNPLVFDKKNPKSVNLKSVS